jgi:hypothetical protein
VGWPRVGPNNRQAHRVAKVENCDRVSLQDCNERIFESASRGAFKFTKGVSRDCIRDSLKSNEANLQTCSGGYAGVGVEG